MREKGDQGLYRGFVSGTVKIDRNKAVPKCSRCLFYRPDFKYRRCLYATCPYGKPDSEVFRRKPLTKDKFSEREVVI